MTTSRSCRKFMAFIMSVALVLSVLFVPGEKARAADPVPSVKVLGATIRLNSESGDNNGKQSMRIGIQVDNANRAYDCAIQLTVGTKTYTVATNTARGDLLQEKVHSRDFEGNSVIYAIVLKNIPESAFYTSIGILGKAWDKAGNLYTSDPAEKNVVGVVNTIQDKFPGLNICIIGGSLYKNAGASKLTSTDISGYSNDPDPDMTSNPLATPAPTRVPVGPDEWEVPFERFEETAEGEMFYAEPDASHQKCAHTYDSYSGDLLVSNETTDPYADGLTVNLPAEEVVKRYTKITVTYEYVGSGSGQFGFKYRNTAGSEAFANNDNYKFSRNSTSKVINIDSNYMPVSRFYIITFTTGISIRLKSIVFSDPLGEPSPTPVPTATPVPTQAPDATAVPSAKTFAVQVPSGSSVIVDGAVDAAWDNAIEYPFLYYSNGRVRNSSEATIRLLWDEDYIYGLYDVYDAYIDQENSDEWNRDGIEIFFDEDNSKQSAYGGSSDANTDAFQYRVSGLATSVTSPAKNGFSHNTSATADLYAGLTSRVKTASNGCGYRVEFAIPVAQKNKLNRVVGLDATVMDSQSGTRNNEMWFTSQKSGSMYSNASLFENVKLIAEKPATPVNSPNPADPADCLAHFTFDNDSRDGYVYKSTDGNAKATVIGSINSVSNEAVSGESLYKAKGNPSYLKLQNADGSSILDGKDNVTISYWSYIPDAYDSNAINYGWAFYAGRNGISLGTSNRYYLAMIDRSDKYRFDMAKSGGGGNNVDNIAKTSGAWNNVTVVVSGTTSTVYVNGVQKTTLSGLTLSEALGTNSKLYIGLRPWAMGEGAEYFQGYIDDFAIFDRAFTSTEVASYVGGIAVPTPGPTATPTPTPRPVTDTVLDAGNVVTNGNFANGTTGWSTNYSNGISNQTVDYTHVLQVASRWNSYSGPKTTLSGSYSPGDVLTYQFKVKRSKTLDNYSRYFVVKFAESSDEHESRPTSSSDGAGTVVGDADHWVTYYGTYTVQEATSSLNIIIMESGYVAYDDDHPAANYVFYLDDVQITRTYTVPTPVVEDTELDVANLVTNGNFANGTTGWSTNYSNGISNRTVDDTHVLQVASRWNSYSGPKTTIRGDFYPGDELTYQYKVKRSKTLDDYTRYFVLKFSETGTENESRPTSSSDGAGTAVGDANHWVTYYGTYTVQEETDSIDVIVMESGYVAYDDDHPAANYVFYLDDVQILKTYAAPTPVPTATPDVRILSCSDYQIWYWSSSDNQVHDDRDALIPQVREIFTATKNAGFDNPDYFLFGGDFTSTHNVSSQDEGMTQLKELVYDTWDCLNDNNSIYIQGNHDESEPGTHGLAQTGAHYYDDFIIYALNEDVYPSTQDSSNSLSIVQNSANTLSAFLEDCADDNENRPIFIASHTGLHYDIDRQDGNNQYAYLIYDAIQQYADDLDIIFLFGHNHTNGDELVGGSITFYGRGSQIDICHEDSIANRSGTRSTIGFTYMNYGYIGNVGNINNNETEAQWLTDILVTSAINIFPDMVTVDRFSKNGKEKKYYSEIPRLHNEPLDPSLPTPTPRPTATPTPTPLPVVKSFSKVSAIEEGSLYAISMSSITPTNMSSGNYYLKDSNTGGTTTVMGFASFSESTSDPDRTTLWMFETMSDGYAIRSAAIHDDSVAYLNITSDGATMGAKQQLSVTVSSESFTIKNGSYLLRFTNSGGSGSTPGYTSGTKTSSSTFAIYKVIISRNAYQSLYVEETNEMPTYAMAFVSDIHIDYGLQSREQQLRQGLINAAAKIREEDDVNVISVLGDVTSNNALQGWTKDQYDRAMTSLTGVLGDASDDGHILMVSGNHDFVAGGTTWNSGDYSGIMEAANYALDPSEYLDQDDDSDASVANMTKNNPNVSMRLAYHYVIDGVDFIGINTPYSGGENHSSYVLTESTMDWVENKLAEIGEDKPIIVLTHYPLSDSRNVKKFMADPYNTELKEMLLPYENAILIYGHDHGNAFISADTYERVTPYAADGTVLNSRPVRNNSFISSFAGSMGYYSNEYNSSLSDAEPDVVQALLIYVYSDRVTFQMKNYGTKAGASSYPEPYTVYKTTGLTPNYR